MALTVVAGLLVPVLLFFGFRALRRKRLIEDVPTSKVKGVFLGLNEVKGEARSDAPLTSFLAGARCVYYRYAVEERWSRTVTERDSKGRTRTRTESGWRTVASGEERPAFQLEDGTGSLRVLPEGAEVDAPRVFGRECGRGDPLYYGKGPAGAVADSDHRRRFTEHAIEVDARVYVIGPARLREDRVEAEIAHARGAELFLVSTKDEKQLTGGYALVAWITLVLGAAAAFLAPVGLALDRAPTFGAALEEQLPLCLAVAGGYAALVLLYKLVQVYNGLVSVRERAEMARSLIDVQLKRRHDLVPRLVECVKGYARHEEETQRALAELRGRRMLAGVVALAERYPDLKASGNFLALQRELADTEDRIALAREFLNSSVTALNNRIESFPDALVAKLTGFRKGELFAFEK